MLSLFVVVEKIPNYTKSIKVYCKESSTFPLIVKLATWVFTEFETEPCKNLRLHLF
jgi:hypothetical protein